MGLVRKRQGRTATEVVGNDASDEKTDIRGLLWSAAFLVTITLLAYAPVRHYGFVNFDDGQYVYQNPNVAGGLTWHNITWALTAGYESNWHPLTWLSHMLDIQLFGLSAGAHHITNLLFHVANTLLLFWLLVQMTGSPGRSTFVAALFAVHPVHVESVAWVAERKDVLSTFFWMLTLCGYIRYVRQPRLTPYLAVLGSFALGLMAKPMLVTLPFVLLLLDFWPLGRLTFRKPSGLPHLIREKIPFLLLAAISSVVTLLVQQRGGAIVDMGTIPVASRVANAFIAYFTYLGRMIWPAHLAVLYPAEPVVWHWWWAAALGVIAFSILSIWAGRRRPYIPVGWFWYLGTLVPVIGLVQVGRQATADRYTYVPLIGLFVIVAFGVTEALARLPARKFIFLAGGGLAIAACIWITRSQLRFWTDSQALWEHTLAVTGENVSAHLNLGEVLDDHGKLEEAISHYSEGLRLEPHHANAHYNLGNALAKSGGSARLDAAASHLTEALRIKPNFPEAHNSLGICYLLQGKPDKATMEFSAAIRLKPDYASAHNNLGTTLGNQGRIDEAISEYAEAVRFEPGNAETHTNLAILLAKQGKENDAIGHFSAALRIKSDNQVARTWLANLTGKDPAAR